MTDYKEKYTTLLLLHNILFYSNYAGKYNEVVAAIIQGQETHDMAPYAGVFSIRDMNYISENSSQPLSRNSAQNFLHVIQTANRWSQIPKEVAFGALQSHQTTMFDPKSEGRRKKAGKKGSGMS